MPAVTRAGDAVGFGHVLYNPSLPPDPTYSEAIHGRNERRRRRRRRRMMRRRMGAVRCGGV